MKKIIISLLGLGVIGIANAGEAVATTKTTATMQATCSIEVNPIGWGVVATPLMIQSAQSEMSVKCSNASAYTIELAYGGIYGQGSTDSGYTVNFGWSDSQRSTYSVFSNSGTYIGYVMCGFAAPIVGKVYFDSIVVANLYGHTNNVGWQLDTKSTACTSNNTQVGTYPKGWSGAFNASGTQVIGGTSGYAYGVMNGSFKGDKLAYSIAVPGDSTKIWNAGNNSYKSSGNGEFQTIPVVAKIVPGKSGSQYPAPDMYLDTITAVISY